MSKKSKKKAVIDPHVGITEAPNPPVPNRAHTEMVKKEEGSSANTTPDPSNKQA